MERSGSGGVSAIGTLIQLSCNVAAKGIFKVHSCSRLPRRASHIVPCWMPLHRDHSRLRDRHLHGEAEAGENCTTKGYLYARPAYTLADNTFSRTQSACCRCGAPAASGACLVFLQHTFVCPSMRSRWLSEKTKCS
eukprot:6196379-Pleurochrysis_carterae.AAC.3